MVDIVYRIGDLVTAPERVIVHGCNARGEMNTGVAKAVRRAYPEAWLAYRAAYEGGGLALGACVWVPCRGKIVVNAVTQADYGYDGGLYVDYGAVESCFAEIEAVFAAAARGASPNGEVGGALALPKLGAGRGGGDWDAIARAAERVFASAVPVVYLFGED